MQTGGDSDGDTTTTPDGTLLKFNTGIPVIPMPGQPQAAVPAQDRFDLPPDWKSIPNKQHEAR
jgi:hypothetical protein